MYAAERQQLLAERLQAHGRVVVLELAEELDVSNETIRRDLHILEHEGLARRVHGGAVSSRALRLPPGLAERGSVRVEEKLRIAQAACAFLPSTNGSVLLDAGTTIGHFVDAFPSNSPMTVLTHAIPIAAKLTTVPAISLHMLGGRVHGVAAAAIGQSTVDALNPLQVDVCFLATDAATPGHGLSSPDAEEAAVKRALVRSGRTVVALLDSSKFTGEHIFQFATYDDLDVVITDDGASAADIAALRAHNVKVVVV